VGKPKAPAAPDYAAAAQQQGAANINGAVASNYLNQVNQHGPDGNMDYSYDYKNGYVDPQTGKTIPSVTATTTLSPEQQQLYNQNTGLSIALNDLAGKGLGYVSDATSHPTDPGQFNPIKYGPTPSSGVDLSKLSAMPSVNDFQNERDQVTNALMARMQPQLQQQQDSLNSNLANQGIQLGSDAYGKAQQINGQNTNDARMSAILAGSQEQQRLFGDAMGINDQQYQHELGNQQMTFNQGLASNQFNNAAVGQAIQQADYFKNQPLNMLNALRSGNQVQMPGFGNVAGGAQIAAAPVYAATNDAYNAALDQYKTAMSGYSGMMQGLGSLGSTAMSVYGGGVKK
jgi:hypothetical protein